MFKFKLKKGDKVKVITGKDRGRVGSILKIIPSKNRAIVSGVNLVSKHMKPTKETEGGVIKKELSIHISNLGLFDSESSKVTKVGYKILEDGKVRFAKSTGRVIEEGK